MAKTRLENTSGRIRIQMWGAQLFPLPLLLLPSSLWHFCSRSKSKIPSPEFQVLAWPNLEGPVVLFPGWESQEEGTGRWGKAELFPQAADPAALTPTTS